MQDIVSNEMVARYDDEISVMRYMRWGWKQLMEAPADLVEEIKIRMSATYKWTETKKSMNK